MICLIFGYKNRNDPRKKFIIRSKNLIGKIINILCIILLEKLAVNQFSQINSLYLKHNWNNELYLKCSTVYLKWNVVHQYKDF